MNRIILWLLICSSIWGGEHAITYEFSGGRFGDNLLSYLHAKWLSYRYDLKLLYKPFQYSNDLAMSGKETLMTPAEYRLRQRVYVKNMESDLSSEQPLLFICPYFPEEPVEQIEDGYSVFAVDWKEPGFRKVALEMISPTKPVNLIEPPHDTINIALHVRVGENYDADDMRIRFPLKLPPFTFYLEAFQMVLKNLKGKKIYCHIFTDAERPDQIVRALEQSLPPRASVRFGYRKGLNRQNFNVLDDFFSLFRFDVLIRSQSNFSAIPSLLHDFAMVCFPSSYSRKNKKVKIEKIELSVNEPQYQMLMEKK